ncbi:MAG: hypothetical protein HKN91_07130, partial [Acidimicrobiia bacterium]|nr:hypothetical protein [Acidimicrobiia bacterium]
AGTPVANIPIANLQTAAGLPIANIGPDGLPVANLPVANIPVANIPVANLATLIDCTQPAVFDCNAPGATVGGAFLAGVLQGTFTDWIGILTIADLLAMGVTDNGAPLDEAAFIQAFVGILLIDLVPDGEVTANLGEITLNQLLEFAGMTLGELLIALIDGGLGNDFFLGDVLLLLVNPTDYPWEDLELTGVDLQQLDAAGGDTNFTAQLDVTNGGGSPGEVAITLPDGFLMTGVTVTGPGGAVPFTFTTAGQTVTVNMSSTPDGTTDVVVEAASSLSIGVLPASADATIAGVNATDNSVIEVVEVLEPNDVPEDAAAVTEDTLYLTHIATEGDVDLYKIPSVQAGSRLSVILSDMDADFDLVLYQPELPPLRPGGVIPEGVATGVSDPGGYVDGDNQIQNELTGDFPRASFTQGAAAGTPLKIYETSTQQGTSDEVITTATLQATGDYYIQVHGSNGVSSLAPYVLRTEVIEAPSFLACSPPTKPFNGEGATGSVFTANAGPYNALILFNEQRLGDYYGATAAADVRAALEDLAGQNALGVNAIVVPVDSDSDVASAFNTLDADRCNPLNSNAVAAEIGQLVDEYRALYPSIEYLTIVGDDSQIPMFRVPDYTEIANESEYALSVSNTNNEIVGSLLAGFMLTDDPYGDAHPLLVDGRELYVSELPQGRLVESPAQILQSIANFTTFNGRLDPNTTSTGLSTGYDFIEDAALGIAAALDDDPRRTTTLLNTDNSPPNPIWDTQALTDAINTTAMDILSLGAHMSHDSLLSALEDAGGTQADLYTTADAAGQNAGVFEGAIIMSMGCHSGFSLSDVQIGATSDWPSEFAELGAIYAAETGFGYGDTEFLAFGEELMRQFAARLNGSMRIGEAMFGAKQFHAANLSQYSTYDEKVIMETVLYGLPFFAVGDPTAPPPAPPILPSNVDPITGLTVVSTSFDFGVGAAGPDGELQLVGSSRGDFYTAEGEAQVTPFHPIQPKGTKDVTQPGQTGTGVFIEELTSQDLDGFDPVFSRPTVDLAAREPELSLPGTFPLALPGINAYLDLSGQRDLLVMVLGQFTDTDGRGKVGTERLFTHVKANVLYGDPADLQVPTITKVTATDNDTTLAFRVKAFDQVGTAVQDVARVYVLYKLVGFDGAWSQLDLTQPAAGGPWIGAVPSPGAQVEYLVQAVDFNGLVAFQSNKTAGNISTSVPPPAPGGLEIEVNGGAAIPVYTSDPVTVDITGADPSGAIEVNVDGTGFTPYIGPFPVSGEGPHTVTVRDGVNPDETVLFIIDTMGPQIFISSPANAVFETGADLSAAFSCTDAGTGVASCVGSVSNGATIDTSATGRFALDVTAIDNQGNTTNQSVTYDVADPLVLDVFPVTASQSRDITATVQFTPDAGHGHTATFDWGDGTVDVCTASDCLDPVSGEASAVHVYGVPGTFNVTVTVDHAGTAAQSAVSERLVIFDATGRFVIGNGEIESPFGSFTPQDPLDPEVGETLDFGFQAKYKRNGTLKGFVDIELEGDDDEVFEFEADQEDLDWFVVSGATAWIRGSGEIEDWPGVYEFLITVIDAQADQSDAYTTDRFRIKIWQDNANPDGWVVYDSGFFTPPGDPAMGTVPISDGKIKIKDRNWPQ